MASRRYTHGALARSVAEAVGWADLMRRLEMKDSEGQRRVLQEKVAALGLDTSHFRRRSWRSGPPASGARPPMAPATLVVLTPSAPRTNRVRLHRALQEIGVEYRCASCGNTGERLGKTITLQIAHISGDWRDNRAENLRYLCPNCHATTDTWCRGRRAKPLVAKERPPVE